MEKQICELSCTTQVRKPGALELRPGASCKKKRGSALWDKKTGGLSNGMSPSFPLPHIDSKARKQQKTEPYLQLALPAEKKEWWRVDPRSHKPFCLLSCTRVPSPPCLFDFPAGLKTGCKMPLNQKLQRTLQLLRVIHSMRIRKGKKAGINTTSPRVSKAGP